MRRVGEGQPSCASVSGHSWLRCAMVRRLATVKWQRPSAVSAAGETVAAFAAHIAEAEKAAARSTSSASATSVPSSAEPAFVGPPVRKQDALGETEPEIVPHLGEALQRRRARRGDPALVRGGGEIAEAEAGIIVARPDHPVEIDLDHRHAQRPIERKLSPGSRPSIRGRLLVQRRAVRRSRRPGRSKRRSRLQLRRRRSSCARRPRLDAGEAALLAIRGSCGCRRCRPTWSGRRRKCRHIRRPRSPRPPASASRLGRTDGGRP